MKSKLFLKPYFLFWTASAAMLVLCFCKRGYSFDFQLHDTYFVFGFTHLMLPLTIWMLLSGSVYWLFRRRHLIRWMVWLHTVITISLIFLLSTVAGSPEIYSNSSISVSEADFRYMKLIGAAVVPGLTVWLVSQVLFFLNVGIAFWNSFSRER